MIHSLTRKHSVGLNPVSMKANCTARIISRILTLATVLGLLLLSQAFSAWTDPPSGQPSQIRSQVKYDPDLSDPFFETEESSCPYWLVKRPDGRIINVLGGPDEKELCLKHTAKCFTSFQYPHWIYFCDATLIEGNRIKLFIHDFTASTDDNLRIIVQNGVFWSQYWTRYEAGPSRGLTWTTKTQELTLDKQVYRRGDVIEGKIVFECSEAVDNLLFGNKFSGIIKIEGVFKTILK